MTDVQQGATAPAGSLPGGWYVSVKSNAPPPVDPWSTGQFSDTPPDAPSAKAPGSANPGDGADPWGAAGFAPTPPTPPAPPKGTPPPRQIGTGEAVGRGALDAASFGLAPAVAGLNAAAAAGQTPEDMATDEQLAAMGGADAPSTSIGTGIARLFNDYFGNHPDPDARAAYDRGRQAVLNDQQLAQEQHPEAFLAGQFAGSVMTPGFGIGTPGTVGARLAAGAIGGAVGGALYGGGSAVSRGENLPSVIESAGEGAAIGAPTGAVLHGVIGPRAPAAPTAGQRAAATAADLGAPLPRGVASDSPMVQGTTAKLQSVPFAGEKIGQRLRATQAAAGDQVGDIASSMTGGATDRAAADVLVRPGLQQVIDDNRAAIDASYGGVRSQIDQNAKFAMPRTDAALNGIMAARKEAGWAKPAEGLEQFRNVAGGATFDGAHRARVDARNAGNVLVPHPGYNAGDFNRLTRAMTADLRDMVRQAAARKGNNPNRALAEFDHAEKQFGALAAQNDILNRLVNAKGEGAIATLLGAAKDKGGNVKLLAQLRAAMPQAEFEQIGGTLLNELGQKASTGEFSLGQFVTNWNKVAPRAKAILFSPDHLRNIEDIVGMGAHIKSALEKANTSHTGDLLVLYDLLKTAGEGALAVGAGVMSTAAGAATAGGFLTINILTRILASPAKSASAAAWMRAYRAVAGNRSPARIATLKLASRNLANTLGLDPAKVVRQIEGTISGNAAPEQQPTDQKQ